MKEVQKYVSQFTQELFPEFYKEEGEFFIAFVKAYYEWMEQNNRELYHSRSLPEYRDIDRTLEDFILYFKTKFLPNIQFNTASNKELFIKNSLDFYRAKGTERAVDLFFKLIYGFEAKVYYPGDDVFKLSDNEFITERYLEVEQLDTNINFVGQVITGSKTKSTAFVERLIRIKKGSRYISVLILSGLSASFETGEQVYTTDLEKNVSVKVIGSLTTLTVNRSDEGFSIGETLKITDGQGKGAKVRVSAVTNYTGIVDFQLLQGGWGYTEDALVIGSNKRITLDNVVVANNDYYQLNDSLEQFETIYQELVTIPVSSFTDSTIFELPLDGTSTLAAYTADDPIANPTPIFEGVIVASTITEGAEEFIVSFDNASWSNTVAEAATKFFNKDDVTQELTTSGATGSTSTANVIAISNTMTIEYELTSNPLLTSVNLLEANNILTQSVSLNNIEREYANAVVIEQEFDNEENKATALIQRSIGQFRNNLGFTSNNKDYTINEFSNVAIGVIIPAGTFYRNAFIRTEHSGTTARLKSVSGFSTEASFTIDDLTNSQTVANFFSDDPDVISQLDSTVINTADYGLEGVGGYGDTIADVISAAGTFENTSLYSVGDIVITNPGQGYAENPFFIIYDEKTKHLERYDFEIEYFNGDGNTNITRNFLVGEEIRGLTSGAKGIIISHDQTNRKLFVRRITLPNTRYNLLDTDAAVNDFIGPDARDLLAGELITSDNIGGLSGVTTRIQSFQELRRLPKSGLNADVSTETFNGNNFITAVELIDSGYGYNDEEILTGVSVDDSTRDAQLIGFLGTEGRGEGYYLNRKSFLSSDKYLHDNDFYQEYSYQVLTALPFNTYKDTLTRVLHVAGTKPFGGYVGTTEASVGISLDSDSIGFDLTLLPVFLNEQTFFEHDIYTVDSAQQIDLDFN